jgi:diaminopimelate epimerase
MRYIKGHGTGNDFIILPDADDLSPDSVRALCDRRTGIGADGILRVVRADGGWFMDYRNADGSIAEMCGNGIRVFAAYLFEVRAAARPEVAIGTRAGTRLVRQRADGVLSVNMGPVRSDGTGWAVVGGQRRDGLLVDVGNPHLACVVDEPVAGFDLSQPPETERGAFPAGVNVEILRLIGDHEIEMRVHERGSGETMSCGTGAVAAAVAAAAAAGERPGRAVPWRVQVPGGRLDVVPDPAGAVLTGPAVFVAAGETWPGWLGESPVSVVS